MKKTVCILLGLIFAVLTFSACTRSPGGITGGSGDGNYEGRTLLISMRLSGYDTWLDDYAIAFEDETGCDVQINWNPSLNSEVRSIFLSDSYILDDLYFATTSDLWYDWAKDGLLYPISGLEDRIADDVASYGIYEGERYMLAPFMPPTGFVYNQEYLDVIPSNGEYVQGEFPETWQGLLDLCDKINELGTINGRAVKPMSWGGTVDDLDRMFRGLWAQGNGGQDWYNYLGQQGTTPDRDTLINDSIKNALTAMCKLINSDGEYSRNSILGCGEKNNIQQQQNFLNGDCVFCPSGGWFETEMKDSITSDTFEYGFANLPQVDTTQTVRTAFIDIPAEVFFIPAKAEEKELALEFLKFVFTEENCVSLHKSLGTPMSFKYTFTENDMAKLNDFSRTVTEIVLNNQVVMKGSNNIMYLTGGVMGALYNAKGDMLQMFTDKMLTNQSGYTINDIDKILENNYQGYCALWDSKLRAAGLK